jgi:hypothetical protein
MVANRGEPLNIEPSEEEAEPMDNPMEGLRQVIREKNAECETLRREIYSLQEKIARAVLVEAEIISAK